MDEFCLKGATAVKLQAIGSILLISVVISDATLPVPNSKGLWSGAGDADASGYTQSRLFPPQQLVLLALQQTNTVHLADRIESETMLEKPSAP